MKKFHIEKPFFIPKEIHKFLLIMKLSFFLLLFMVFHLSASVYSQEFSLDVKNQSIRDVLKLIESKSNYRFFYNDLYTGINKTIDLKAENKTITELLGQMFDKQEFYYTILENKMVVIGPREFMQQQKLTGTVTDALTGEVIIGANVIIEGTTIGVVTDINGKFTIDLTSSSSVIKVTYIGYNSEKVTLSGQSTLDIKMIPDITKLDEVVVVGYGSVKKSDLTGAVASVSQKDLKDRPNNNVMQSVAGKVAGVQILQTDGSAGYSPTVRVRGASSITSGTTPLYVIDGIPMEGANLNIINPSDIESMEILKDASSAAIYGSRGSNGVVLITTKSGVSGKTIFEVNYEKGFSKVSRHIDMMNSQQYIQTYIDAHNNSWIADKGGKATDPNSVRPINYQIPPEFLTDPGKFATTDWQDAIFRKGVTDNVSFSMNGGNEKTKYMISSSYLNQQGIVDRNDFKRYTLRTNLTHKVNANITLGANISLSKRDERALIAYDMVPEIGKQAAVSNALTALPFYPVYNDNGTFGGPFDPNSEWNRFLPYGIAFVNPLIFSRAMDNLNKSLNTSSNIFVEWKFLSDFTFKSSLSATIDYSAYNAYMINKANYGWDQLPASRGYSSNNNHYNWLSENTVSFKKTIGEHSINAFVGYTAQKDNYENGSILATGFPNDQVRTLSAATTVTNFSTSATAWSLLSYIGRANYTYKGKYLMTATLRRDGSSRFGNNTKWGYFPSASLGWRVSEEDFMKSVSLIDNMKLRISYGVTGNNLIPNYGSVGLLGQSQYAWGTTAESALYINSISNPDLKWEKTGQWDLGLNIGLFASRIYMEFDYYQSKTRDMLLNVPVPAITGFTSQLTNIGELQNKGFEFLLSTKNLVGNFKWSTDFNISANRNKVLKLGSDNAPILSNQWGTTITEVGKPIANFYGYIFDGVFMNQTDLNNYPHLALATPGDPRIRDVNEDGKIDANDRATIGNAQPDFIFGITNNFQYKNFDFSFCLQGQYGNEIMNSQARFSKTYNGGRNEYAMAVNYWKSESDPGDGTFFKPMLSYNAQQNAFSSFWVEDGSYLRIRNVQLGYNLPQKVLSHSPFTSVKIYVNAENLHVFSSYSGYDPENSAYSGLQMGNDYGATPMPKTISVGLKVNF